ncbi:telomeric repeat-binding factor 2-like isoform X1 [Simochromis diagramma]|uniref:telomeric repeat-binding factor 2-like isoform X1 n=1 Tax=Simochromis diagramma TaxID=43689 RepID=UPI001A7E3D25|nr:telomeric repeat-binding factor 2-like isoform X1 [Simochromis diagramma]
MNMAAKENVNSRQFDTESVVNRWVVDYYLFLALELFKKEQYEDFCAITDVLDSVLVRPYGPIDFMPQKIQVWRFLCRINEGDKPAADTSSQSVCPLESALMLLESMSQEFSIPQQDFKNVCTSIKEMIIMLSIKNGKFEKAGKVLNKHFTKEMDGRRMLFMGLISKKNKKHEVIEQINFARFKMEMLAFCERLCPSSVPFLQKAANQLIREKNKEQDSSAARADEQVQPVPSSSPQVNMVQSVPCKHSTIQRTRLEAAYKALATGLNERMFSQLEEEVETEDQESEHMCLQLSPDPKMDTNLDLEQEVLFQRDSGSPMEASPADQPPQADAVPQTQESSLSKTTSVPWNGQLYTLSQLVMEPDSQASSQCSKVSEELETEARVEEAPQTLALSNKRDSQCPVTDQEVSIPAPKRHRRTNRINRRVSTSFAELSAESEEDSPHSVASTAVGVKRHNQSSSSPTRNINKSKQSSSDSEGEPQKLSESSVKVSPSLLPLHPVPQTSSTPHKDSAQLSNNSYSKKKSKKSIRLSSDSEEDPKEPVTCKKTPVQKPHKQLSSDPVDNQVNQDDTDDIHITDSSVESSPSQSPSHPIPQTSSTPHKDSAQKNVHSHLEWNQRYHNAKETKEVWSDEELYFTSKKRSSDMSTISNSGQRKRKWTESETQKLKDGVKKFGEGNWSKIKAYYKFKDRTNVNLKDRWRTMKKSNIV